MFTKNIFKVLAMDHQELFDLREVKNYLRISYDYDDYLISSLLDATIGYAESFISLGIRKRVIEFTSNIQNINAFSLKYHPIMEIENIQLKTGQEEEALQDYRLDPQKGVLYLSRPLEGAELQMRYSCGFTRNSLSPSIKQGILLHTAQMYDRSDQGGVISEEVRNLYLLFRKVKI